MFLPQSREPAVHRPRLGAPSSSPSRPARGTTIHMGRSDSVQWNELHACNRGCAVDLLAEVSGLDSFEEVRSGSVFVDAFGRRMHTLDLRSLIQAKRAAGARRICAR